MSIKQVKDYFRQYGIEDKIQEFDVSSKTVELASLALGCEPKRIAKTMSFLIDGKTILIVSAGDAKIANAKYKKIFGVKAKMIPLDEVEMRTGHVIGGVCPFATKEGVKVYLDISLQRFDTTFAAAGSSNSAIELTADELEKYSKAKAWIDVCKDWEEENKCS